MREHRGANADEHELREGLVLIRLPRLIPHLIPSRKLARMTMPALAVVGEDVARHHRGDRLELLAHLPHVVAMSVSRQSCDSVRAIALVSKNGALFGAFRRALGRLAPGRVSTVSHVNDDAPIRIDGHPKGVHGDLRGQLGTEIGD